MEYNFAEMGEKIKKLRKNKKRPDGKSYSQDDLCNEIGISRNTLSNIEQGKIGDLSVATLCEIASFFEKDISYLLGETPYFGIEEDYAGRILDLPPLSIENLKSLKSFPECIDAFIGLTTDYFKDFVRIMLRLGEYSENLYNARANPMDPETILTSKFTEENLKLYNDRLLSEAKANSAVLEIQKIITNINPNKKYFRSDPIGDHETPDHYVHHMRTPSPVLPKW